MTSQSKRGPEKSPVKLESGAAAHTLFEVSWEVANKVGGIHTVISTKAKTLQARYQGGESGEYVAIGPWLLREPGKELPFDEEPGFDSFTEACREAGVPVRVGRWRIPGRPRTLLVEFTGLYDKKDDVLSELWEEFGVDSISGGWDYIEPVLFGHAAAIVIELWWEEFLAPRHRWGVAQFHEWMTGSGLLRLKQRTPSIGTVFTTHATMLGRAMSSLGISPDDGLGDRTARELAEEHNVVAKHSLEGVCAREADVFTTVSQITAKEAALLHDRAPDPILPNGIDLDVIDEVAGPTDRADARRALDEFATRFLGESTHGACMIAVSGRYEYHNKGMDVLLEALGRIKDSASKPVVLWVLVPAGNSGLCGGVLDRAALSLEELQGQSLGPVGLSTHNLFEPENDPVHEACGRLGFDNARGSSVKVIQVPIYLHEDDGWLDLPYEAVLRAMDLSCFPSYYEPWGYTPQESLAVGVPTITSDYAGFGRWVRAEGLGAADGVQVIDRVRVSYEDVVEALEGRLGAFLAEPPELPAIVEACRSTASRTAWSDLIANYECAFDGALGSVRERLASGIPIRRRPPRPVQLRPADATNAGPRLTDFEVRATLPESLRGLERLARNFWWCWDADAKTIFRDLSPHSWELAEHDPIRLLARVFREDVEARAADKKYVARLESILKRFDAYLAAPFVRGEDGGGGKSFEVDHPIAYFSAEFGVHDSLRIYSGGLGVLAGDHLKSASDLKLPLVAVGLFYRFGYMTQRLSMKGEQIAVDVENRPAELPVEAVLGVDGQPLEIEVQLPGRKFVLRAWKAAVGRVPLYLLDADTPSNRPEDRDVTRNLYGGDHEMRLKQEIVLGRGGARLLDALGIQPSVWHINEGHAAFLTLERVARFVGKQGWTFEEARELVRRSTVFTTHTPVPAGHDRFGEEMMRRYFSDAPEWVGLPWERFMALGQAPRGIVVEEADADNAPAPEFNMTYLALHFAVRANGVAKLHGVASRKLLHPYWPQLLEEEVPIRTITNGIHLSTWVAPELTKALGAETRTLEAADFESASKKLKPAQLWNLRRAAKAELVEKIRASLRNSFVARGDSPRLLGSMLDGLEEDALYVGFARRFAPYKRAHLLFSDMERLLKLVGDEKRPLRFLVAGKAHPADQRGKDILRGIAEKARTEELAGKVIFLEDYGMDLASSLVQGVDVWLNNPTRMLEASGTSGMKAAANGGLNLSIADGWWPEGFDGQNGWRIADDRVYQDQELQDQFDSQALYTLLEEEVVPLFFERDAKGLPSGWLERSLHCLETVPPMFNTNRMVSEYADQAYRGLGQSWQDLTGGSRDRVRELAAKLSAVRAGFEKLRIVAAQVGDLGDARVGDGLEARIEVDLAGLEASDIVCELVVGHDRGGDGALRLPQAIQLKAKGGSGDQRTFQGTYRIERSGRQAYGLRVRANPEFYGDALPGLVRWA